MVRDSLDRPVTAPRTSSGVPAKVSESVLSAVANCLVLIWVVSTDSWLIASTTSYGEVVRDRGISVRGLSFLVPRGSSARYFWPSNVLIFIAAVDLSPIQAC